MMNVDGSAFCTGPWVRWTAPIMRVTLSVAAALSLAACGNEAPAPAAAPASAAAAKIDLARLNAID
jgi:hypothetical protein